MTDERRQEDEAKSLVAFLMLQWPCVQPSMAGFPLPEEGLIDLVGAMDIIRPEWQRLYQNFQLSQHINQVQTVLDKHRARCSIEVPALVSKEQVVYPVRCRGAELLTLQDLLKVSLPRYRPGVSGQLNTSLTRGNIQKSKALPLCREAKELRSITER